MQFDSDLDGQDKGLHTAEISPHLAADRRFLPRHWDAIVIGAGPAGAVGALLLARAGKKLLLVDKAAFPRSKVCGSCLSAKTLLYLNQAGLGDLPHSLNAAKITGIKLCTAAGAIRLPLPLGLALSREALDNEIVTRAEAAGAVFLPATSAFVGPCAGDLRAVNISPSEEDTDVQTLFASCVLVADGINGRALSHLQDGEKALYQPLVAPASRIGAGIVVRNASELNGHYRAGTIFMAIDKGGYVGLVRLENGGLDMAAAFDPQFTRQHGSPQAAAKQILQRAGLPYLPIFDQSPWSGTAALTRHRQTLATKRIFVIGDAASYGEPFTGEGIAWALGSALLVVPIALTAIDQWHDTLAGQWQREYKQMIGQKQAMSLRLGKLLRDDQFSGLAIGGLLRHLPFLAKPIVDRACR